MYEQYRDRASFLTVYIREAHPTDEWQIKDNEKENVCYMQPRSVGQRVAIANDFVKRFRYCRRVEDLSLTKEIGLFR